MRQFCGGRTHGHRDPDRLNLAAVLEDGQKVLVPIRGEPGQADAPTGGSPAPGSGTGGTGPGSGGGKINLNTAGLEELGTLPRVGPVLAQRIVDWRQAARAVQVSAGARRRRRNRSEVA